MRGEFEIIAKYFAPLAADAPGTFGLQNDAAVLEPVTGEDLVATLDTMVAGVHYRADEPPDFIARRLLRVNLSDLAAMGARPVGYLLSFVVTETIDEDWVASFTQGLAADQKEFGLSLLGGDTVRSEGAQCISLTALGSLRRGAALSRSGAKPDDHIFVSGTIGDGALGLDCLEGKHSELAPDLVQALIERFQVPKPRLDLGTALGDLNRQETEAGRRGLAALDVSDGLVADLGHLTLEQGLGARLELARVPLSPAAKALGADDKDLMARIVTGGDDYELLFTADPALTAEIAKLSEATATPVSQIGEITEGHEIEPLWSDGSRLMLQRSGWRHF
jgi:thiamine-monophosphate kinase